MNRERILQPPSHKKRGRRELPLFLTLTLIAVVVGAISAFLQRDIAFIIALGDALVIESFVLLGLAWVGYLKKDGIRFWPKKSSEASAPESWKDRVPALGEAPPPPPLAPDENGPESPEYQRLAAAEKALRKRIVGGDGVGGTTVARIPGYVGSTALAGSILLILGLCFEYVVPVLLR